MPTPVATDTPTPAPADLIVVGPPQIISTRPLVAYRPIDVRVVISNTGDIDVGSQFFVDIYFDPVGPVSPTISITQSLGFMGVSSLAGGASRVLTITAPFGFENEPEDHLVYGMVDSVLQIVEDNETNNVSTPLGENQVTPAATPTPSPTPAITPGTARIGGIVRSRADVNWLPQPRAAVTLIDENLQVVGVDETGLDGGYLFVDLDDTLTYTVKACVSIDNESYYGLRVGVVPTNLFADVFLLKGPCP